MCMFKGKTDSDCSKLSFQGFCPCDLIYFVLGKLIWNAVSIQLNLVSIHCING